MLKTLTERLVTSVSAYVMNISTDNGKGMVNTVGQGQEETHLNDEQSFKFLGALKGRQLCGGHLLENHRSDNNGEAE